MPFAQFNTSREGWINYETKSLKFLSVVGHLWINKSVEMIFFRKRLLDINATGLIQRFDYAKNVINKEVNIEDILDLGEEILRQDIYRSRIDVGTLAYQWKTEKSNYTGIDAFIQDKLKVHIGKDTNPIEPKDVVLFGLGRIGRILVRELAVQSGLGQQLRLKAIVTRGNSDEQITKRADLLRKDSVHGKFPGVIREDLENKALLVNGATVHMISSNDPSTIDYTKYGIKDALIIDNTGVFRDREGLGNHLKANGIEKVLLTAPGKGDIPNIVYGVNHEEFDINKENIFSAASCTTNAIAPVLKLLETQVGIQSGHLETIHSYTNDQNLLDNFHKKSRRGRSAPLNMVITETGANKAVAKAIPSLKGKLTANAVRVPTPNASLAILVLNLDKATNRDKLNNLFQEAAHHGEFIEEIEFSYSQELVSTDVVGKPTPAVVDGPATVVSADGKHATIYVWYDNEYGYTRQVMNLTKHLANVRLASYY